MPDNLLAIRQALLTNSYQWSCYRSFFVCDPKKREILAAPFKDRIVHQAIHQIIGKKIQDVIPGNSYACLPGMGNRHAAMKMLQILKELGPNRHCIKLDVSQYFFSINHKILLRMLDEVLAAPSLYPLLESLLRSHEPFSLKGVGIPIGNVTSQSFANLYLSPIDRIAAEQSDLFYIRYMDDMVVAGREKKRVRHFAAMVRERVHSDLQLTIPYHKCCALGSDPVPFLGYVMDHNGYRPLSRNKRRHKRRITRCLRKGVRESLVAMKETSFAAWARLC